MLAMVSPHHQHVSGGSSWCCFDLIWQIVWGQSFSFLKKGQINCTLTFISSITLLRQKQLSIHKYTTNFRCFMCRGTHLDSIMVARGLTLGALILHNNLHTGAHYATLNTAEIQHTLNTVQCKHMLILWWCKHIYDDIFTISSTCALAREFTTRH